MVEFLRRDNEGAFQMNLIYIIDTLRTKRMVFHSEADFQFALAWQIQQSYPDADIRLEYPASNKTKEYVDILVKLNDDVYPIELKYKTKRLSISLDDEVYALKQHGAGGFGSYDFIKDICRL